MSTRLESLQARLDKYLEAEAAILTAGQEGVNGSRRRREAELAEIRKAISDLEGQIANERAVASGDSRLVTVYPR